MPDVTTVNSEYIVIPKPTLTVASRLSLELGCRSVTTYKLPSTTLALKSNPCYTGGSEGRISVDQDFLSKSYLAINLLFLSLILNAHSWLSKTVHVAEFTLNGRGASSFHKLLLPVGVSARNGLFYINYC